MNVENRTIFEGDNLHILRGLDSETIDLIYLDPPFNSRTYEAPIGSDAAGAAFKDTWTLCFGKSTFGMRLFGVSKNSIYTAPYNREL